MKLRLNESRNDSITLRTDLQTAYKKKYPTDSLGKEITPNKTLGDLFILLFSGNGVGRNTYQFIGVGDSVVREGIFQILSDVSGYSYDEIYNVWLS